MKSMQKFKGQTITIQNVVLKFDILFNKLEKNKKMYIDFWNGTIYYMSSVHTDICILIIPSFVRVSFLQKTYFWNLIKTDDTFFRAYNKRYLLLLNTSISKCKCYFFYFYNYKKNYEKIGFHVVFKKHIYNT